MDDDLSKLRYCWLSSRQAQSRHHLVACDLNPNWGRGGGETVKKLKYSEAENSSILLHLCGCSSPHPSRLNNNGNVKPFFLSLFFLKVISRSQNQNKTKKKTQRKIKQWVSAVFKSVDFLWVQKPTTPPSAVHRFEAERDRSRQTPVYVS